MGTGRMRIVLALLLLSTFTLSGFGATKPVTPVTINPSVTDFDSIPPVTTDRTFYITLTTDTSTQRSATGIVGTTRVHHGKMAPIVCEPLPAVALKNSLENLLTARGQKSQTPETATNTLTCTVLDFTLKETNKNLTQTMEASVVIEVVMTDIRDPTHSISSTFRARNSRSTLDTSKYAGEILRGAFESALREIYRLITK